MITEIEQASLDIDWFFTDGQYISFMASGGGRLPGSVSESEETHKILANYFRNLPEISDVIINPELNNILIKVFGSGVNERYLKDYVLMARKGLFSFDKTYPNNFMDPSYHLVATPRTPLDLKDIPDSIMSLLTKTKYTGDSIPHISEIDISEIL